MTLEPETASLDSDENPELKDFRRRFFWTLPLTVIVAVLAMAGHRVQSPNAAMESWIELALSLPIVLWAGKPFFVRAVQSVIHRSPNMWTLIGLGTSAAFLYSVIATFAPGVFPASFVVMGRVPVYFEAAAVIISLTLLGQLLELNARSQTSAAIKSLLGWRQRLLDGSISITRKRMSRSQAFTPAIRFAYARAKKCRSMESCSKESARSTNRC